MKRIITIVHTESNHYVVDDAVSDDDAIEQAKTFWANGAADGVREISLGNEFADIDRAYVDEKEQDADA